MSLGALEPSPRLRALAGSIALGGIAITHEVLALALLASGCAAVLLVQGNFQHYARFLVRIWLPVAAGLGVVWALIVRGSPESGHDAGVEVGLHFALVIALRLAALAALFQGAVLSLKGLRLAYFFHRLGMSPSATAALVSIFNL